jgi:hypothetical protein
MTVISIMDMGTHIPARGRSERAFAICIGMTPAERGEFLAQIGIAEVTNA